MSVELYTSGLISIMEASEKMIQYLYIHLLRDLRGSIRGIRRYNKTPFSSSDDSLTFYILCHVYYIDSTYLVSLPKFFQSGKTYGGGLVGSWSGHSFLMTSIMDSYSNR